MDETPLRKLRKQTGMSAYAFGGSLPITREYYYILERGEHKPGPFARLYIVKQLSEALGRPQEEIERELNMTVNEVVAA